LKIIADFNATGLERIVASLKPELAVEPQPYGQFMQGIYRAIETGYDGLVFLWLDFSSLSPRYTSALSFERYDRDQLDVDLDNYISHISQLAARCKGVIVTNFVMPAHMQGTGLSNLSEGGPGLLLAELNLKLYRAIDALGNAWCLDQNCWFHSDNYYNGKLYHAGKIPFNQAVFRACANDLIAAADAVAGRARKLLVLDLDDTLWGGTLGDDGRENLKLGAPSAVGEAYSQFQTEILALKNRGIVLAIASKNYEDIALDAIRNHPEMQLKVDDFSSWRINWDDKAENIAAIAKELNLGLQSVVFIDDNPSERGQVAETLSEVLVPDWPKDPCEYVTALRKLTCFSVASLSDEDRKKTEMLRQENKRDELKTKVNDKQEWFSSLQMKVTLEGLNGDNVTRIVQLLNKTNQFNLRTRRLTQGELERWSNDDRHYFFAVRVSDRFGDMGLTGLVGLRFEKDMAVLEDFILSCRVMGRNVERLMLECAVDYAETLGVFQVQINYQKTAKNRPMFDFLKDEGIITDDNFCGFAAKKRRNPELNYFEIDDQRHADH
jgi:FkbH-like protein